METIEVRTDLHVEPEAAFEFLVDFTRYGAFSPYVTETEVVSSGPSVAGEPRGRGTTYDIGFGWWRLSYRVRTEVTEVDTPKRIAWRVVSDLDASGRWELEPTSDGRTSVSLFVHYDTDAGVPEGLDLPALLSFDWVLDRVVPLLENEGRRVIERVVAAVEGTSRPVDVVVEKHMGPSERWAGSPDAASIR